MKALACLLAMSFFVFTASGQVGDSSIVEKFFQQQNLNLDADYECEIVPSPYSAQNVRFGAICNDGSVWIDSMISHAQDVCWFWNPGDDEITFLESPRIYAASDEGEAIVTLPVGNGWQIHTMTSDGTTQPYTSNFAYPRWICDYSGALEVSAVVSCLGIDDRVAGVATRYNLYRTDQYPTEYDEWVVLGAVCDQTLVAAALEGDGGWLWVDKNRAVRQGWAGGAMVIADKDGPIETVEPPTGYDWLLPVEWSHGELIVWLLDSPNSFDPITSGLWNPVDGWTIFVEDMAAVNFDGNNLVGNAEPWEPVVYNLTTGVYEPLLSDGFNVQMVYEGNASGELLCMCDGNIAVLRPQTSPFVPQFKTFSLPSLTGIRP